MPETPGGPEYYTPSADASPPAVPAPPSIADAAAQLTHAQYEPGQPPVPGAYPQPGAKQGLAITALVLGLIALVTGWIPVWGILLGAIAIIFGIVALAKRQSKGMAIGGLVTGAIGALTSVVVLVVIIIAAKAAEDALGEVDWSNYDTRPHVTLGPTPVDGGLVVTEQAFAPLSWDDSGAWYVVILNNPDDAEYTFAEVIVNALDASGNVVATSANYPSLAPGDSAISGAFYDLDGADIAALEVLGPSIDGLSGEPGAVIEVSELTATSDDYSTRVSGTVTSPAADLDFGAAITVVARDASGSIIGAAPGYVSQLTRGAAASFDANFYELMPDGTTYEAYASAF